MPMDKEEQELNQYLEDQLEWVELEELDAISATSSNKRALDEVDEMSVDTFGTEAFNILSKKACNNKNIPSAAQSA